MTDEGSHSSLDNALRILNLFTMEQPELGVKEAAAQIGVAASTAHRLMSTFKEDGILVKDNTSNRYRLGISILALGSIIQSETPLIKDSHQALKDLSLQTNETVLLGVIQNKEIIYIDNITSPNATAGYYSYQGQKFPIHSTGGGRLLLAYEKEEVIQDYLSCLSETGDHIIYEKKLAHLFKDIRKKGYAFTVNEHFAGVSSVACLVRTKKGTCNAAIEVIGPNHRFNQNSLPKIIKAVHETASFLSRKNST